VTTCISHPNAPSALRISETVLHNSTIDSPPELLKDCRGFPHTRTACKCACKSQFCGMRGHCVIQADLRKNLGLAFCHWYATRGWWAWVAYQRSYSNL